jgi:hypothetical protein
LRNFKYKFYVVYLLGLTELVTLARESILNLIPDGVTRRLKVLFTLPHWVDRCTHGDRDRIRLVPPHSAGIRWGKT